MARRVSAGPEHNYCALQDPCGVKEEPGFSSYLADVAPQDTRVNETRVAPLIWPKINSSHKALVMFIKTNGDTETDFNAFTLSYCIQDRSKVFASRCPRDTHRRNI